jgi:DNA invertase Pin-like site-specific DNA recombinase
MRGSARTTGEASNDGRRVAAYVRVSSKAQTFEMQRAALEFRAAARAGEVRRLYVFRLDRLARSGIRDLLEVVDELRAGGVDLVTVADGFDLGGPAAEVVLAVMAWAAKMERLAINERIAAARVRLEGEGRSWVRPSRVSPLERARLHQWRDDGLTIRDIAQRARIPRATVARALSQKPPAQECAERPAVAARGVRGRK